jgi:hypothetical protein
MTPNTVVTYQDANARVEKVRAHLTAICLRLDEATRQMEAHEEAAIFSGEQPDSSYRTNVLDLRCQRDNASQMLHTLEQRLEALRQQEEEAERAAKREAAEAHLQNLLKARREKANKAIAAVFACNSLFAELYAFEPKVRGVLVLDLQNDQRVIPPLPPSGLLHFGDSLVFDNWAESLCEYGYADAVPDSVPGKRRFINKRGLLRGED